MLFEDEKLENEEVEETEEESENEEQGQVIEAGIVAGLTDVNTTDIVKESFDININHIVKSVTLCIFVAHRYSICGASVWSKAVTLIIEFRFAHRLHYLQNALLHYSVNHSRYSERSHFAIGFGDIHSSNSFGLIVSYLFPYNANQLLLWHSLKVIEF